jgi:hypothetical protein
MPFADPDIRISVLILPARKKLAGTGPARTTSASRLIRCAAQGSTRLARSDLVRRLVDADHAVHKRHGTASRVPRICKCRCSIKRQATGDAAVQQQVKEDGRSVHVGPQPVGPRPVGTRPAAAACPRQTRWPLVAKATANRHAPSHQPDGVPPPPLLRCHAHRRRRRRGQRGLHLPPTTSTAGRPSSS